MTAIDMIVAPDLTKGWMLTNTAIWHGGQISGFLNKAVTLPQPGLFNTRY